jgi:hypothetical protein
VGFSLLKTAISLRQANKRENTNPILDAKQRLAIAFNVPIEAIEITIRA